MRNAGVFEINLIQEGGHVLCGVMYDSHYGRVHRKKVGGDLAAQLEEYVFLMETAENDTVVALHSSNLRAVPKGPSYTPKKPKRKPVKGTKPWTKIPYRFEDVEVGDTVTYERFDGKPCKFLVNKKTDEWWRAENGCATPMWKPPFPSIHITKPYKGIVKRDGRTPEQEYYRLGDRFEITFPGLLESSRVCRLCMVGSEKAMLISDNGNRWTDHTCPVVWHGLCHKEDVDKLFGLPSFAYKKI